MQLELCGFVTILRGGDSPARAALGRHPVPKSDPDRPKRSRDARFDAGAHRSISILTLACTVIILKALHCQFVQFLERLDEAYSFLESAEATSRVVPV